MADLYTALAIMLCVSLVAFASGLSVARRLPPLWAGGAALLTCAFVVVFALRLRDHLAVSRILPLSAVVIYGNMLPPAVALLAGLAWRRIPSRPWRKAVLVGSMALLCLYQAYGFLLASPPSLNNRWANGVCLQTSPASCSAAAAATLLRAHGIQATESEMAELCLTRSGGTSMSGLYRGLKLKSAGTPWDVEAFGGDIPNLAVEGAPVILSVRLDRAGHVDPRYERAWGWVPGVAHTVVFYSFGADGKAAIGDPAIGREHWRVEDLQVLWHGRGIRLVRRQRRSQSGTRRSKVPGNPEHRCRRSHSCSTPTSARTSTTRSRWPTCCATSAATCSA